MTRKTDMKMLVSTGHIGTAPSNKGSFQLGLEMEPDFIAADGGSSDPGPVYLGEDTTLGFFHEQELELFLTAARSRKIPLVIGSAGDTGSNRGVDSFVETIKELAQLHKIPKFKLGYFYSEVPTARLQKELENGGILEPLDGLPPFTDQDLMQTNRIVAVAGVHPFLKLLEMGADVIIGGRASDAAIFAAPAIHAGFPENLAYHVGKIIECASFCAEPFMGKEAILGTVTHDDIKLTACHPDQRCTVASVSGHSMYERKTPYFEHVVGGRLDMTNCTYEQFTEKTTRVTGSQWKPDTEIRVKLEGTKKIGERYLGIAGLRDPFIVRSVDAVIDYCRKRVDEMFGKTGYELHFHVFGKDGVLKEMEPVVHSQAHELAVVVECVSEDGSLAEKITDYTLRMMFLAGIPGVKGTAGAAATTKKPMRYLPGYSWSLNHTIKVNDPMEFFSVHIVEAGI